MTESFRIGVISSVHGIHGEAKVFVTSDSPERFKSLKTVRARRPEGAVLLPSTKTDAEGELLELSSVRFFKQMAICKFRGIDTPEEMRKYQGMELWISRSEAIPLSEGEFYIADLIGLSVVTEEDELLGTVAEIWPTGANHVITVRRKNGEELLLPYIRDCVKEILPEEGLIRVHLMEGLI
ncbi:16S rRNA processing protein RimM [Fusobacterium naviforme]|uniref:Ribosome maturation factor RimM n=1 Tax=Moryella indoligenes TaxID=371674 RepID=A0AAE3V9T5_9FIRM|nr:ribosome maturation factor RimM [Moryella indoligenes]KAB0577962.1 16S rRNA processing protein RimM [Fusobacterium naviforme]MDQ0152346.1 16S rRNA processing protein RimM [Moryella indoligenes]PSL10759.1 16S rRNA processing protein RimM [Fusobacterium naviforme]STO27309.1 Ribosome maturation factor rimM [Fusobacterium naviforme]